jgi:hypothetical protein
MKYTKVPMISPSAKFKLPNPDQHLAIMNQKIFFFYLILSGTNHIGVFLESKLSLLPLITF